MPLFRIERVLGRSFDPRRYGVCVPDDLVTGNGGLRPPLYYFNSPEGSYIELTSVKFSKNRDRLQRQLFALLSTKYRFRCPIESLEHEWRNFFGRPARLSHAGLLEFHELADLYSDTFEMIEKPSASTGCLVRYLRLTSELRLVAFSRYVETTLRQLGGRVIITDLVEQVRQRSGMAVVREDFGVATDELLCERLGHVAKIENRSHNRHQADGAYLVLLDDNEQQTLLNKMLLLLMDSELAAMPVSGCGIAASPRKHHSGKGYEMDSPQMPSRRRNSNSNLFIYFFFNLNTFF